jgi:hypothetical protein
MEVKMSKQLPKQPSLEHLKNEAKALLRLAKSGDPDAVKQIGEPRLANAQLAVAREYGFDSWAKLKRSVEGFASQRDALFAAIRAGDRDRARAVLSENPSLVWTTDPNAFGASVIGAAGHRNDIPMIELLLECGADIDGRSDWWAGSFGALDFADEPTSRFLLSKGATLTAHAASRLGMARELREIVNRNPSSVHERGGDGQFPLHFAKTPEIVDILLEAGANIDARDLDHEGTAAQTLVMNLPVLRRLVERGAATDIFMAIALDDLSLVEKHVSSDPRVLERRVGHAGNPMIPLAPGHHVYTYNIGNCRPAQAAVRLGRAEIYDYLFARSSPRVQLLSACWKPDRVAVTTVLKENPGIVAELPDLDRQLICEAAHQSRAEAVEVMLEAGFDVATEDGEKFTAAHWASFHGRADILRIILPYRPDLEKLNRYDGTVLTTGLYGSLYGWNRERGDYAESTEVLIKAGAKLPDKVGGSPEAIAVLKRYGNY